MQASSLDGRVKTLKLQIVPIMEKAMEISFFIAPYISESGIRTAPHDSDQDDLRPRSLFLRRNVSFDHCCFRDLPSEVREERNGEELFLFTNGFVLLPLALRSSGSGGERALTSLNMLVDDLTQVSGGRGLRRSERTGSERQGETEEYVMWRKNCCVDLE
eukprot:747705-Hanusia_phi.AAC.1